MPAEPERILLIRPSALGDVCRTVPVLVSLRARFPGARIDWLVRDAYAPAVAAHPDITGVVSFPRAALTGWWKGGAPTRHLLAFLHALREPRYDMVIDCQGLFRSGVFAAATGSRRRLGWAGAPEAAPLFYTRDHRVRAPRGVHTVEHMLALAAAAGAAPIRDLRLYPSAHDRAALDPRLRDARFALLAPTSRWPGKRWPAERFAVLANRLLSEGAVAAVAVVGGPGEREQCGPLTALADRDPRVIDLIGRTSVGGLLAAVERSALVVANDSAALHMAVGLARPLVALFGPTRVDLVGPYGREADVIQHAGPADPLDHKHEAAGRALMERISVDEVFAAALQRLRRPAPRSAERAPAAVSAT